MRQPRQDRSRASTERVLEAVLQILADEGLPALTTSRVAAVSGTSNGTIYHRFGTRQALLHGAHDLFIARLQALSDVATAASGEQDATLGDAVRTLVAQYVAVFEAYGPLIRAFTVAALTDEDLAARGTLDKLDFSRRIAAALDRFDDQVLVQDRDLASLTVHRILFGTCTMRLLFHGPPIADEETRRHLAAAVLGVLRPEPRPEAPPP